MRKVSGYSSGSTNVSVLNYVGLSSPDVHKSVSILKRASLDCGFFYVVNHGITQKLMDEAFSESRKFFGLPIEEKMVFYRNEKFRGYTPLLDEHLDPRNQQNGDYKEGYYLGIEVPETDSEAQKSFNGANMWPSERLCLSGRIQWRHISKALEVAKAVARIIALALDLDYNFFDKPEMLGKLPIATLRLLRYEERVSDPSKGIFGAGAHTDYGFLTLLATDDVQGLQICRDRYAIPQKWKYVSPIKGSTLHCVIGNDQDRYSIAFFVDPSHDCLVECLPTCKSKENPPGSLQ